MSSGRGVASSDEGSSLVLRRRLHGVDMPTGALEPPLDAMASPEAKHDAEVASLSLAVLVRLTAHAGAADCSTLPQAARPATPSRQARLRVLYTCPHIRALLCNHSCS